MRQCKRCCLWAAPLALLLGLLLLPFAKGRVDHALRSRARAALATRNITGVNVSSNWAKITLRGPGSLKAPALAAAVGMKHHKDAQSFVYVDDGSTQETTAPTTTAAAAAATTVAPATTALPATTAAPTTTSAPATTTTIAAASLDVSADVGAKKVTLTGFVAGDAERKTIVDAATAAFGAANVVDQLIVKAGTPATGVDAAVAQLAKVIDAFGAKVDTGKARLIDTALTVSGTGFTKPAADEANTALAAVGSQGIKVTGTVAAPAAPDAATLQARLANLLGRSGINFASGSADITAASIPILDTASESILQVPGVKIEIGGHTDNVGSAASNQSLSERRANAVLTYIVGKGAPADQLTAAGFGDTQPIAGNDTEEGRAQNRRIEFKVQGS